MDSNDISGFCCYIISFRVDFFYIILFYIAVIDIDFNCFEQTVSVVLGIGLGLINS